MLTTSEFCKKEYGEKLYKLALSGKFSCPNRDGKIGYGGCIFCSEGGSGDFASSACLSLDEQIEAAKKKVAAKFKGDKYIAYFQSFSNTYASADYLKSLYFPILERDDIAVISIATRPDCLGTDVMEVLAELAAKKPLWVELGLQTIKPESVKYIRRGYDNSVYDEAVLKLKNIGAHVISHVILGLPGESKEDMIASVRHVCDVGSDGIKLQLLYVIRGTDLAKDYEAGKFNVLEEDDYIDILKDCMGLLPENMVVHRLTGDGSKKTLIAPLWSANKREVLNRINREVR